MNKIHKIILISALSLILLSAVAYGFLVLAVVNVVNCQEFFESPPGLNYLQAGYISGVFNLTGSSNSTTKFFDICVNNQTLVEFVCGGSISPAYSQYAGAVLATCPIDVPGTTQCITINLTYAPNTTQYAGRCQ